MKICIAGNGKLSNSLITSLAGDTKLMKWDLFDKESDERVIVVHAGSGRQFGECLSYCSKTESILLELSTEENFKKQSISCPLILCPNTAIPILKMMNLLKLYGDEFSKYQISIMESHQSDKKNVAGTAVEIAKTLNVESKDIKSLRDKKEQLQIGIPAENLELHAYHKVTIIDAGCEISIELKVLGHSSYIKGITTLLDLIENKKLENKVYDVVNLLQHKLNNHVTQ